MKFFEPELFIVFALPMVIFSPIFDINETIFSSTDCPFFIKFDFTFSILEEHLLFISLNSFTKFIKSSFFATKSVSQFTSITDVWFSSPDKAITPSFASLDIFFDAFETPFILKISIALSKSPFDSFKAELQSLKPAPVECLNFLTFSISLIIN